MSLLFQVLFHTAARSTHHKMALDALRHLRLPDAQAWMDVFLRYNQSYLDGAKAPDTQFKDFKNHVLHVQEKYWGGAVGATKKWYDKALAAFKSHDFEDGVYSVGVLSHYFTDALMPLHTGQSEDEGPVHRAVEWSICKSYGELQHILDEDLGGYPRWECPADDDWLGQMVRRAAELSNPHYETVIDHYDVAAGTRDPLLGMDQTLKDVIAKCIGYAVIGLARIIERLIEQANVDPPFVEVTLQGFLAAAMIPYRTLVKYIEDARERETLRLIYEEFEQTGKVVANLPPDDAAVRQAHASEVLQVPLSRLDAQPIRKPGTKHGQGAATRGRSTRSVTTTVIEPLPRSSNLPQPEPAKPEPKASSPLLPVKAPPPKAEEPVAPKKKRIDEQILRHDAPTEVEETIPQPIPVIAVSRPVERGRQEEPELADGENTVETRVDSQHAGPKPAEKKSADKRAEKTPAERKLKFYLDRSRPIVDAPSIGNKTAERMKAVGVNTVGDLLASHPEKLAAKLNVSHIIPDVIRQWQAEATLVCRVPGLRGHDAQILVACGIDQPAELAKCQVDDLLDLIQPFIDSPDGQRVLRGSPPPDEEEVTQWIAGAQQARSLKAA